MVEIASIRHDGAIRVQHGTTLSDWIPRDEQ